MAIIALEKVLTFGPLYTLTGGWECMFQRYALADVLICIAQPLAVSLYGRSGPKALWTGIITSEFIRYVPTMVLLAWLATSPPPDFEMGPLHRSAYFWWTLRAIVSSAAIIWLCMKRERPGWRMLVISGLASVALLGLLSHRDNSGIDSPLPWNGKGVMPVAVMRSP
ncbi:hypothetical protein [Corallococcus macrosporus]|uniref:Uncharacterized protein n=1 Tax=Corallococcus macrosporus DSM 14697 TaxID=1189310 RepID=A0A250JRF4_9BACT|nr:hypothetical protein [Corallococcus macrosporus]ATB46067.1 hypothetical protein MYMAC_001659 [Corallococcus macrosporus DSM 14697]